MTCICWVSRWDRLWYTSQSGRFDKSDAQVEQHPTQEGEEEDNFAFSKTVRNYPPKGGTAKFNEVSNSYQQSTLAGGHPQLFIIHRQKWVKGAIGRVKEKIKYLGYEQVIIYFNTVLLYPVYLLIRDSSCLCGGGCFIGRRL